MGYVRLAFAFLPAKIQTNRKQSSKKDFSLHFNHTTFSIIFIKRAFVSRHFSCFDCQSRIFRVSSKPSIPVESYFFRPVPDYEVL